MKKSNLLGTIIFRHELLKYQDSFGDESNLKICIELNGFKESPLSVCPVIVQQFEKLFNNIEFSDLSLILADGREVAVHKNILCARSPIFKEIMKTLKESILKIEDVGSKAMLEFLRFIYCGYVNDIDEITSDLLLAAQKFDVPDLKPLCSVALARKLTLKSALETIVLANKYGEKYLETHCKNFILR
jgi:BTB/POZ domain